MAYHLTVLRKETYREENDVFGDRPSNLISKTKAITCNTDIFFRNPFGGYHVKQTCIEERATNVNNDLKEKALIEYKLAEQVQ